ncbi:MAG: hypothetical protein M5U01_34895 [Ardenticatenaceae bacterium]|nr:hypothetical protein [Ardenticatenaceae bacterium]HBY99445.1 hypothetical protein [Chloroflexota bacterium]
MSKELSPTIPGTNDSDGIVHVDDVFIEEIWHDLGGQVPREQIYAVASEVADGFRNATVTTFVPLMIRRRTLEKLKAVLNGQAG